MIGRVWAICLNTYREAVRQKVFYTIAFFMGTLILLSLFLGQLSLRADTKVIKDMGLASMMIFGALISIFMGIGLIYKEIDRRTIYTILSKPVRRSEFVVGKYLGLLLTLALQIGLMTALLFGLLSLYNEPPDFNLVKAVAMIFFELTVVTAVALVFSAYSSSLMSTLFCLSFLVLGHLADDFGRFAGPKAAALAEQGAGAAILSRLIQVVRWVLDFVSLDHFAISARIVHGVPVPWSWVRDGALLALGWAVLLLSLASWLFRRRDLK